MPFMTGTPGSPKNKIVVPNAPKGSRYAPKPVPASAHTPAGARKYAEENTVTETTPSGKVIAGPAGTKKDVKKTKRGRERVSKIVKDLKAERKFQVDSFKADALTHIAEAHLKVDDHGKIETTTEKIPVIKTSPKAIKVATAKLNKQIHVAKIHGASPDALETAKAVGARQIAKENYALDKKGEIKFKTVEVPKLKTSPEALRKDLKRYNETKHEIAEGQKHYFHTIPGESIKKHTTPLGELAEGVASVATDVPIFAGGLPYIAKHITPHVFDAAKEVGKASIKSMEASQAQQDMQFRAAGLDFIPNMRTKAMHGIRTGVLFGTEYLTRPGLAIEAQIAHELGKGDNPLFNMILGEEQRKKLAKSATPVEALLHGHGAKNIATGGDITEALLGLPQLGIGVDFATDPFMYIGFAGLPARFAERTAALTARLADEAPQALKSAEFTRMMENAQKSGDYESVTKYLEGKAKAHGVSLKRLGKTKLDKAAISEVNKATAERAREIADLIHEGRATSPKIKGQSIHVPGEASQRAAEEIAKFGLRRSLKPGFTLELRTPFGRKLTGIDVPVPKSLANKRFLPRPAAIAAGMGREPESSKLLEMARSSKANAEIYTAHAAEHEELLNKVNKLEATPTTARADLHAARDELAKFEDTIRARMMEARAKELGSKGFASPNEAMRSYNAKRFGHEIYRATNALGRQTQRQFFHNVMRAIDPVLHDRNARLRIGTHMALEADTGSRPLLDEIAPLGAKEEKVLSDLNNIYAELAKYGFETGTLRNAVENYLPRYWSSADDIGGPLHAGPRSEEILPLGGKRGASSAFQQHRTMAEMAAIADKQKLAQLIRKVATKPISTERSLELAEHWFKISKVRFAMEDMAQAVNRGFQLKEEQMTKLQKAAYEWSGNMVSDSEAIPRLFRDLEQSEGVLKLHPEAFKFHNFVEDPFTGLSARDEFRVKLSSAMESEHRIIEAMDNVKKGSPLHKHYEEMLAQRREEIKALRADRPRRPGILPSQQAELDAIEEMKKRGIIPKDFEQRGALHAVPDDDSRPLEPVNDGAEAPTAEMVGLPNDAEIADFLPNATDEYIGTLKDFRRDHPDQFPVLDPMLSNYHRTRAEGLQTVYRSRWRSMDASVGRSTAEARASRYRLADGRTGYTSELKPVFEAQPTGDRKNYAVEWEEGGKKQKLVFQRATGAQKTDIADIKTMFQEMMAKEPKGFKIIPTKEDHTPGFGPRSDDLISDKPIGYAFKETGEHIDLADIEFPGRTLIPNREYKIWYDPINGREYSMAADLDNAVGGAISDAIGPDRLWPTDVIRDAKAEFYRMGETGMTDLYDSGLENLAQRTLTMIRYGVTTLFPAFHVRNMISDTLQSMLGDPGFLFHPISNAKLTWSVVNRGGKFKAGPVEFGIDKVKVPGLGTMPPEDYLAIMDAFGLRSNQHIAEMARLAERGDVTDLEKWYQGIHSYRRPVQTVKGGFGLGPSGAIGKRAVEASARREDIMRIITFTQRMRRNGGDFADAMWWTIKHHFDYGDLTGFERRWMRNLFLFYTWYRKNIPLQFLSIITRPGFFSGMTNAYIDLAQGQTPLNFNWSKINPILPDMSGPVPNSGLVPDYMFTQLAAPSVNWNGHALAVGFGAPWSDINLVGHFFESSGEGLRSMLAMFNPAVSLPFQYAFQSDLLTGRKFDKREASGPASIFNWLGEKFGFDPLKKDENGNPMLPWQLNLVFNQLPIAGRLTGYFRSSPITEDQGRLNKLFGGGFGTFMTGFNAYVSPKEGERLDAAYISRVIGRAAQRAALSEEGGNDADLAEFDRQTQVWAKQLGIPHKYLEVVPGIGPSYITQEERKGFKLSGGSPLTGGGTGELKGLLGGEGGLGKLELGPGSTEYKSQTEESVEKLLHPGKFNEQTTLTPLQGSILPTGSSPENALASGAAVASAKQLNSARARLKLNALAREGKDAPKKVQKEADEPTPIKIPKGKGKAVKGKRASEVTGPYLLDKKLAQKEQHVKHLAKQVVIKKLRKLKGEVNKGKLPQFSGFTDKDQEEFAQWLTHYSGLNPKFVGNWVMAEGGGWGSDGVSGGEAGEQNWLGVGYPGEQTDMSRSHYFNNTTPKRAAKATAEWIEGKIGSEYDYQAAPSIQGLANFKGRSAEETEAYLAGPSAWGTGSFSLDNVQVTGYGGKKNPKAEAQLQHVEAVAEKLGIDPEKVGRGSAKALRAKKLRGAWAGTENILLKATKGFDISSTKRTPAENAAVGGAEDSDHLTSNKNTFATDLPTTDGRPIAEKVAKRLGFEQQWTPGNYDWYTSKKYPGYRFQLLWEVEGHYDHVHVGAEYTGEDLLPGTYLGGPVAGSSGGGGSGGGAVSGGVPVPSGAKATAKERVAQPGHGKMLPSTGSSSSASLGTGAFLTATEAFNLGGASTREGQAIVDRARKELEALNRPPQAGRTPTFKMKRSKL